MPVKPLHFVHASDLHLDQPPYGVAEIPPHLQDVFIDAAHVAAQRVFDVALDKAVDFVVLAGDLVDTSCGHARGIAQLHEQFTRLAEHGISVYWTPGDIDSGCDWPDTMPLPSKVHVFPSDGIEGVTYQQNGHSLARLIGGRGRGRRSIRNIQAADFPADPDIEFTIAVSHGSPDANQLADRGIDYWALGGEHQQRTICTSPHVAVYPGSPQGRCPAEPGPHGITVAHVDESGGARIRSVTTDLLRWHNEVVDAGDDVGRADLESLLHRRTQELIARAPDRHWMISWTIHGGPAVGGAWQGEWPQQLLGGLREQFGHGDPAAWTVALQPRFPEKLPDSWYEEDSIAGEFLRGVSHYQQNPAETLDLEPLLAEAGPGMIASTDFDLQDQSIRERTLREAAFLGAELLRGESEAET